MTAADLEPGVTYYYAGATKGYFDNKGNTPEPAERTYRGPFSDEPGNDAYLFIGEAKRSYTHFGPELLLMFYTVADAHESIAEGLAAMADLHRKRAAALRSLPHNQPV